MTREEAIWWVNHLFEIRKEEYFNKGMMKDAKEVEKAQRMAIEALTYQSLSNENKVVHCRDCKRRDTMICPRWPQRLSDDDCCSCGDRKEDDGI